MLFCYAYFNFSLEMGSEINISRVELHMYCMGMDSFLADHAILFCKVICGGFYILARISNLLFTNAIFEFYCFGIQPIENVLMEFFKLGCFLFLS